jgi:hypothetical protein
LRRTYPKRTGVIGGGYGDVDVASVPARTSFVAALAIIATACSASPAPAPAPLPEPPTDVRARALVEQARTAARLGRHEDAARLFADAAAADGSSAEPLGRAAVEATAAGDPNAPALRERAIAALEKQVGQPMRMRTGGTNGKVVWSPDGQWLALLDAGGADVLDAATFTPAYRLEGAHVLALTAARAAVIERTSTLHGVLRIVDLERGLSRRLADPVDPRCPPAISRDGQLVAVAAPEGGALLLHYKDAGAGVQGDAGSLELRDKGGFEARELVLSPDGKTLYATSDYAAHAAWNTQTGAPLPVARHVRGDHFCITPEGEARMQGSLRDEADEVENVVFYDFVTGKKIFEQKLPDFVQPNGVRHPAKGGRVWAVSADCRRITRGFGHYHDVVLVETGVATPLLGYGQPGASLAPGVIRSVLSGGGVEVFDWAGKRRFAVGPEGSAIKALEHPARGARVTLRVSGQILVDWDLASGERIPLVPDDGEVLADGLATDGKRRAYKWGGEMVVANAATGEALVRLERAGRAARQQVALHGSTLTIVDSDYTFAFWDVAGQKPPVFVQHKPPIAPLRVHPRLSPTGERYMLDTGWDVFELRDARTNTLVKKLPLAEDERTDETTIREGVLQIAARGGGVRLFDAETGSPLGRLSAEGFVALTDDRARAAYVAHDELVTAELPSGKVLSHVPLPKRAVVERWVSPDVVAVLTGPYEDKTAVLLRVTDGTVVAELRATGPRGSGYAVTRGKVSLFGEGAQLQASCVIGPFAFPITLCESRFVFPGALAAALGALP